MKRTDSGKQLYYYLGTSPDVGCAARISYLGRICRGQERDTAPEKAIRTPGVTRIIGRLTKDSQRWFTVELNSGAGDLLAALRQSRAPVRLPHSQTTSTTI